MKNKIIVVAGLVLFLGVGVYILNQNKMDADVQCAYSCEGYDLYELQNGKCHCQKEGEEWKPAN